MRVKVRGISHRIVMRMTGWRKREDFHKGRVGMEGKISVRAQNWRACFLWSLAVGYAVAYAPLLGSFRPWTFLPSVRSRKIGRSGG